MKPWSSTAIGWKRISPDEAVVEHGNRLEEDLFELGHGDAAGRLARGAVAFDLFGLLGRQAHGPSPCQA
jgi:hypothetical protein